MYITTIQFPANQMYFLNFDNKNKDRCAIPEAIYKSTFVRCMISSRYEGIKISDVMLG